MDFIQKWAILVSDLPIMKTHLITVLLASSGLLAPAAIVTQNFEGLTVPSTATPSGWTYINVNGGSNAYTTATGNGGGVGAQITGDNATNGNAPPGSYLVNDGSQAFDVRSSITGSFDYFITTGSVGRAQGGVFMFGDIQTGITGATAGTYLGMQMMSDSFGNRGGVVDGSGSQIADFSGNQVEQQWYNITFTWTPTSGTTGNFSATGSSTSSSNSWTVSYNGYTFDTIEAWFGFGAGDYFNNPNTATYDNINITGTAIPEPGVALLSGLGVLMLLRRRKR